MVTKKAEDAEIETLVEAEIEGEVISHSAEARKIVERYTALTAGLAFIPVPVADAVAIGAAQYSMIDALARLYGQDTSKERVRAAVLSVLGGGIPTLLNSSSLNALVKAVPVVGPLFGVALLPTMAGATTAALGRAFSQHFEVGGTLLSMDAKQIRAHFEAEFQALKAKMSNRSTPVDAEPEPAAA